MVDPAGKLRVLAIAAEPPEVRPGEPVAASALVVIHPRFGLLTDLGGELGGRLVGTPTPRGLSVQWRACRLADAASPPVPCGMVDSKLTLDEQLLETLPGPASRLVAPPLADLPYTLLLTLIAADEALPGGAAECHDQAVRRGGVSPDADHCVIAVKRIKVSTADRPNRNPALTGYYLGSAEPLRELSPGTADYPLLAADLDDRQRPQLTLAAERAADAVEAEPDPQHPELERPEILGISFFTTAGTLEAGRGSFLDLGCPQEPAQCPQLARAAVAWQPPAARAATESPDGVVFFFTVLRDDRGGTSFRRGHALAR